MLYAPLSDFTLSTAFLSALQTPASDWFDMHVKIFLPVVVAEFLTGLDCSL